VSELRRTFCADHSIKGKAIPLRLTIKIEKNFNDQQRKMDSGELKPMQNL
jgi:hypothetical protein